MTDSSIDATTGWKIFQGDRTPNPSKIKQLPRPPKWRDFGSTTVSAIERRKEKGKTFQADEETKRLVNAALYLRRPLLVTGPPGSGKSSLAYAIAYELGLGEVLSWSITTKTSLKDGQYSYDAIGRVQEQGQGNLESIGDYITLGPLGTALMPSTHLFKDKTTQKSIADQIAEDEKKAEDEKDPTAEPSAPRPKVLLIDEIDKSDIDLPNDLLHIFEEGRFSIPELERIADKLKDRKIRVRTAHTEPGEPAYAEVSDGRIQCDAFPLVILTSNGERDFPPPFLRRCVRLTMPAPNDPDRLKAIVKAHLGEAVMAEAETLIANFLKRRGEVQIKGDVATDQLLNTVFMLVRDQAPTGDDYESLKENLLKHLSSVQDT